MSFIPAGENRRSGAWSVHPIMLRICSLFCAWSVLFLTEVCGQSQRRTTFTCGGNITGDSGVIGSPGYPGVYPPNTKCVWRITVPEGKVVVLSFRFIDLESDNLCRYDYVDVYSGHVSGQRLGRFCGTFRPGALVSTGNKMLIQMVSDANTAGSGFLAVYSAAQPHERGDQYCGGRLVKPSGSFKTPNWPEKDYPAGVTCSWHIVAPKNQIIEVKFEKFDVERDNYCRYDYVAIFNGAEINDAKRIGKYCGDSPPAEAERGEPGGEKRKREAEGQAGWLVKEEKKRGREDGQGGRGEGPAGAYVMARGGGAHRARQRLGYLNTLLRCNLHPETQKVVVFMIMMLLVIINVVLMFLLAF
ncbi:procollagen C-endopeptidase enhancer 2-like [Salvelinus alpinus]